jgi:hypothetical protein
MNKGRKIKKDITVDWFFAISGRSKSIWVNLVDLARSYEDAGISVGRISTTCGNKSYTVNYENLRGNNYGKNLV